jgi:phosphopentomutase
MSPTKRCVIWIVLDGVGAGALPDAADYGDAGANTLEHTAAAVGGLHLPNLGKKGLGNLASLAGVPPSHDVDGAFGRMREVSPGKDSTSGHWELAGVILDQPFPLYPRGFPPQLVAEFERSIGSRILGNRPASGTEIISALGEEHMLTGRPILYTSADSVFQLAAHKDVIPLEKLYAMCRVARGLLRGKHAVSRVIARPFTGEPGSFERIGAERLDLSLAPPRPTVLELCKAEGLPVRGIGKVGDLYAGKGFDLSPHTAGNSETMSLLLQEVSAGKAGILMANLVDFDMVYGHRRDPGGFAAALREFDAFVPQLEAAMGAGDLCVIVSDHGCDPTHSGTDHTREYGLLLLFGADVKKGVNLGTRGSFADCGKSIADFLNIDGAGLAGTSFVPEILRR